MRVRVSADQGERALQFLREIDPAEGLLKEAVHCPQCASSRIEYPQFSRRTLMSALPAAAAAAGLIDREFYCEACGYTWNPEEKDVQELDVLNWPKDKGTP